jgi:hypothetical protein
MRYSNLDHGGFPVLRAAGVMPGTAVRDGWGAAGSAFSTGIASVQDDVDRVCPCAAGL